MNSSITHVPVAKASSPRLVAAYHTVAGNLPRTNGRVSGRSPYALADRADAAARAGYVGIGLERIDLAACVEEIGFARIRQILRDAGLSFLELEVLVDWFADGERRERSDAHRAFLLKAAGELGAAQIKLAGDADLGNNGNKIQGGWSRSRQIDSFGELCREASAVGCQINLEIYPASDVRDLETATAIAGGAGESNGGIIIDVWHMARGGIGYERLAEVPQGLINHVELVDAAAEQIGTIHEDTSRRRLLPGEGALNVPEFIRYVLATGYDGHFGVEIVSDAHRARPLPLAAKLSFEAALEQFQKLDQPAK